MRRRREEGVSAHGAGVAGPEPVGDASATHDMAADGQADGQLEEAGVRVHDAAFFHADDAFALPVGLDAVVGSQELAQERLGHGGGEDGWWTDGFRVAEGVRMYWIDENRFNDLGGLRVGGRDGEYVADSSPGMRNPFHKESVIKCQSLDTMPLCAQN